MGEHLFRMLSEQLFFPRGVIEELYSLFHVFSITYFFTFVSHLWGALYFTKGASEVEKKRKQYEAEKEELTKQIGQLTIEVNWLKKKSAELYERRRKT